MNNFELAKTQFMSGLNCFQRGDYLAAEDNFRESLRNLPDRVSTMTNLAGTLIKLNKLDEAKELCRKAIAIDESSAEAWLNLGLIDREKSDFVAAAEKFERAISINADYAEAHQNLQQVSAHLNTVDVDASESIFSSGLSSFENGDYVTAEQCFRDLLARFPDELSVLTNLAATLIKLDQLDEAEELCLKAVSIDDCSAMAWLNLGLIDKSRSDYIAAAEKFKRAIEEAKDFAEAYNNYGLVLNEQSDYQAAIEKFRRAIDINPDYAEAYNNLGLAQQNLTLFDDASVSFNKALSINPDSAAVCRNIGTMMRLLGKIDEAERWFIRAVELAPDDVSVLSAALYHFPRMADEMDLDQIESAYVGRDSLPTDERIDFGFAIGKVMEHAGRYDQAFSAYADGNRLHYQADPFDETKADESLDRLCGIYSSDLLEEYAAISDSVSDDKNTRVPIFIVGMPRSGSTLIEQIISSHNEVFGAGELAVMGEFIKEAESFVGLTDRKSALSSIRAVGQKYLDQVWRLAPEVRFITDKMLGNHEHLGLIHLFFPQAKIIHSMRDPMDTCFSCYATKFTEGNKFCYDLEALGRHYLRYTKFMGHWHRVLPQGRILDVRYEDIVDDTEHEVKRILEYLELPWDQECLSFYKNTRAVKTASASQVRKPIYTSSVARWKRFQDHLSPLMEIVKDQPNS